MVSRASAGVEVEVLGAFREMLPADVAVAGFAETRTDLALPAERAYASRMAGARAAEFLTGRVAARVALRQLGIPDTALLPAPDRSPIWPVGVVGSISHTAGFCVAAVSFADRVMGVGIDVEQAEAVTADLARYVATPAELARHQGVADARTRLFSTKEAVFKCFFPLTGLWLEFHDVEIEDFDGELFRARVGPDSQDSFRVEGQVRVAAAYVLSAVVVRPGTPLPARVSRNARDTP